ncbi:MAG: nucleotidyltransferase family protein [Rhodoglobus sp.]|nr:nucleotidyltransferase family protein [Rhodoglobus sp.]
MIKDVSDLKVSPSSTVRETIATISANRRQVALVASDDGLLLGLVTDGDIRRGILRGVDLESLVVEVMNPTPYTIDAGVSEASILEQMEDRAIRHMPVVDDSGCLVGIFTVDDLRHRADATTPVVLMAGGRGQRLYPLTKDVPKPMLPIGGVPLLEIILRSLATQGFVNVYISVNYLADVIVDYVGDGKQLGLNVKYIREDKPLGTAGALADLRGAIAETFIVMNSDLLTHVNLRDMLSFHDKQGAKATVGVREHLFEIPYGVVNLNGSEVESMVEKPMHRSLVNAGIYALEPMTLDQLAPGEYADMPTLLSLLMEAGHSVAAFPIHESWLDVGRPEDLSQARTDSAKWIAP